MLCAACGSENPASNRFCDQCGAPMVATCPACNATNRPHAQFCAACGFALPQTSAETPTAEPGVGQGAEPASARASIAERRLVSVLFTDLVGFTSLAEDRDPETVRDLLSRYFDESSRIVGLHGGSVEKFIGDAVMAVWGTPVAHEDDAERAVRAGLEMVDAVAALHPDLRARASVLTGEAAVTVGATNQAMVAGDLVNTAARLQGVAEPGTVVVGEATMRAASAAIAFERLGEHSLRGKASPVPAWRAMRVVAARGGQRRMDTLEPPFIGRVEELRELKNALHAVARELRPRLVSITGPAGIGKSRLAWELEKYADGITDRIYWHRGRSPSYGEGIAFWALGEMVRRRAQLSEDDDEATTRERIAAMLAEYVADASERAVISPALLTLLGVEPAPSGGRDSLFPAWRLFFERIAERATTVLAFEDLQWADSGLLDFIEHLLEWSRGLPVLVVTLARPELYDRRPDWGARRRHLTALALERLTDGEIGELLDALVPGLPRDARSTVVGRAEGIPLYAVEIVRGLIADGQVERRGEQYVLTGDLRELPVPESLRSLIASRLDGLDPADRALLQNAAVLGQSFTAAALAETSGVASHEVTTRLRDLVRRELLAIEQDPRSPEAGQYRFVQSLMREIAYATMSRRERRSRHLVVARYLEALADEEAAGALASHYLAAHAASEPGEEADALKIQARRALVGAADRAAALGAHAQAVHHLEEALGITDDMRDRARLLERAVESGIVGALPGVENHAHAAREAYRAVGDDVAVERASAALGRTLIEVGSIGEAVDVLEAAADSVASLDAPEVEAEVLATLSRAYMRHMDDDKAVAVADRALELAEVRDLEDVVTEALLNRGTSLSRLGQRRQAVALLEAAVARSQGAGDTGRELRARNNLATLLVVEGAERAAAIMWEAMDLARRVGDRTHLNWLASSIGVGALFLGQQWDDAMGVLEDTLEDAELPADRGRLWSALAMLRIARGQGNDVLKELDDKLGELDAELPEVSEPDAVAATSRVRAFAALAAGRLSDAYRHGMFAAQQHAQQSELGAILAVHAATWELDLERTRESTDRLMSLVPGGGDIFRAMERKFTGLIAGLEGRPEEATRALREAREQLDRSGQRFEWALSAIDAAALYPGDREVREWASEARDAFIEWGASPFVERLEEVLRASRGGAEPAADLVTQHAASLTTTEGVEDETRR